MNRREFIASLSAASLIGVSSKANAAEQWSLYHHQSAPQFTTSLGAKMWAENVEKETAGQIKVRVHYAGTLQIATNNITSAVSQGVVQLADDLFFSGNAPLGAVLRLPFLVQSYDEFAKASAILQPIVEKDFASKGVIVLAGYAYPLQYIWGRKEMPDLNALKGMKIRVASPEQSEFVRRFGATPVTIGASEVPSALDRGVVDGIVTGSVGADLWQDLLRHGLLVGLNFNNSYYIVNAGAFNKLSADLQGKVRKAATDAAGWNQATMREDDDKIIARLGAGKMTIVKPAKPDLDKAVAEMRPYWDQWAKERGPAAADALAQIRQALGR